MFYCLFNKNSSRKDLIKFYKIYLKMHPERYNIFDVCVMIVSIFVSVCVFWKKSKLTSFLHLSFLARFILKQKVLILPPVWYL